MKRFIAPFLISSLIISGALLLYGAPAHYHYTGTPAKIDTISIDPALCASNCERSKVWSSLHRHSEDEHGTTDFNVSNMSMTFEKKVGVNTGYFLLKNNKFNGGMINLNLTDALEPKVFPKTQSTYQTGYLKIIRFDTIGNDTINRRVVADFHARDTTGRISFPAIVTFSDNANQKPAHVKGNFVIDALVWKLYPVDSTAVVTKDELKFSLDLITKKQ